MDKVAEPLEVGKVVTFSGKPCAVVSIPGAAGGFSNAYGVVPICKNGKPRAGGGAQPATLEQIEDVRAVYSTETSDALEKDARRLIQHAHKSTDANAKRSAVRVARQHLAAARAFAHDHLDNVARSERAAETVLAEAAAIEGETIDNTETIETPSAVEPCAVEPPADTEPAAAIEADDAGGNTEQPGALVHIPHDDNARRLPVALVAAGGAVAGIAAVFGVTFINNKRKEGGK